MSLIHLKAGYFLVSFILSAYFSPLCFMIYFPLRNVLSACQLYDIYLVIFNDIIFIIFLIIIITYQFNLISI